VADDGESFSDLTCASLAGINIPIYQPSATARWRGYDSIH
jgi:hypothetical protein